MSERPLNRDERAAMFQQLADVYAAAYFSEEEETMNNDDRIAIYINQLDTEGLSALQVRSIIYAECMERGAGAAKESHYRGLNAQETET